MFLFFGFNIDPLILFVFQNHPTLKFLQSPNIPEGQTPMLISKTVLFQNIY